MFCLFDSADRKTGETVLAPASNNVLVHSSGTCEWDPLYVRSITHCAMDITWFPFDEQYCNLIYESWKYRAEHVNFTAGLRNNESIGQYNLEPNGLWEVVGKTFFIVHTVPVE